MYNPISRYQELNALISKHQTVAQYEHDIKKFSKELRELRKKAEKVTLDPNEHVNHFKVLNGPHPKVVTVKYIYEYKSSDDRDYDSVLSGLINDTQSDLKKLRDNQSELDNIVLVFIMLALIGGGVVGAGAAFFAPQIAAGATLAFIAAKPYLIALGAAIWAAVTKSAAFVSVHQAATAVVATLTGTAAVVTPLLCFKKTRETTLDALESGLGYIAKAHAPQMFM